MSITVYDPEPVYTAGKSAIVMAPAVANLTAPKVSEINAGVKIDCAIEGFSPNADVTKNSRKKLCDLVASETLGSVKYSIDDLVVAMGDPQKKGEFAKAAVQGTVRYFIVRPGVIHSEDFSASQEVWVIKTRIAAVYPDAITTDDGNEFAWKVSLVVEDATWAAIVAA